ncbi:MAG: aldo/keto reductase [Negativicutes bacterium]|nr:aldo/keto reductase [Negativicutes bacterium]
MEKVILGRTGLEVSVAGLGCGGFSRLGMFSKGIDNACSIIRYAYDHGVNFFDTAYSYGTQPAVGQALAGIRRDSYIISTKFPYNVDGKLKAADELEKNVDDCLKELQTDYIDIYHLHGVKPEDYIAVRDQFYPELIRMREKGKIRFTGITEHFGTDTTHQALKVALADDLWDVIMVGYNLLNPSAAKTLLPITMEKKVGTLCMFAVRGSLSDPEQLKIDVKKMLAAEQVDRQLVKEDGTIEFLVDGGYAQSIIEAAYRFCRHTKGIDVTLTGTGTLEHLAENFNGLSKPPLPKVALEKLEAMFGRVDCVSGQQSSPGR